MTDTLVIDADITLTPFRPGDQENMVRYLNDPETLRNTLSIPDPYTMINADEWIVQVRDLRAQNGHESHWVIRHREAGYIGGISCFFKTGIDGYLDEIGYALAPPWRGRGLMTKIVSAFTDWQFAERPALVRLQAMVFAHNPASERVLEKAGYVREGYHRKLQRKGNELLDIVVWAKIRE